MRKENKEYLFDLLQERLSLLDERTEQEWEDAADPKGEEMKLLVESIDFLTRPNWTKNFQDFKNLDFFI